MLIGMKPAGTVQKDLPTQSSARPIYSTGEMADLIRSRDWSQTALGPIEAWSETLLAIVNVMLLSPFSFGLYWGEEKTLIYNDVYRHFLGEKHPAAFGGHGPTIWQEAWPIIGLPIEKAFQHGKVTYETDVFVPILIGGKLVDRWWTYGFYPIYENGRIRGVANPGSDDTPRMLAKNALLASEAMATRVLQSIGDAVIVTDAGAAVKQMNPVAEQLTGWSNEQAQGRSLSEVFRIVNESTRAPIKRANSPGVASHTILIAKDGNEVTIDESSAPIRDEQGELAGAVLVFRNIEERRRAEREQRKLDERLEMALSAANGVGIWDWDVRNDLVFTDANFAALYGVEPEAGAQGMPIAAFLANIHRDDLERIGAAITTSIKTGEVFTSEYRLRQGDGSVRWVFAKGRCSYDEHGNPVRFPGVTLDITERVGTEEALRGSEERLRVALETARLGSWDLDVRTGRMECSDLCKANYGRAAGERFDYDDLHACVHPDDKPVVLAAINDAIENHRPYRCEYRVIWPNEELHWVVVSGRVIYGENEEAVRMAGVSLDATERHKSHEALIQTEKLAAVGRLAASIAHEINNPLESVTNLLYLARNSRDVDAIQDYLSTAERELRRVSVITNQTLRFYRQATHAKAVHCEELLGGALSIYQGRLMNARISVEKRERAQRPVQCFEGEIRQVLNNLVGNAIDAMAPHGGRLLLRSRDAHHGKTRQQGVCITIADTGSGMSPQVLQRIFEAFYTTKGIGGTGLGLWISKEIIDRHQGTLRVRTSQRDGANGTVFLLFLPVISALRPVEEKPHSSQRTA